MKSKEYIIDKLDNLYKAFSGLTLKYKYDELSETHIIFVDPESYYKSNGCFVHEKSKIISEFLNLFMDESILFITNESCIDMENSDYLLESSKLGVIINDKKQVNYVKIICGLNCGDQTQVVAGENNYAIAA